jgi:hypothetical protein
MASMNRRTEWMRTLGKIRQTTITGCFAPNTSSAITQSTVKGANVASVTYVSTGLYRVNLTANVPEVLSVWASGRFATKNAGVVEVGTVSAGTSETTAHFFVRFMTLGTTTLADITADANNIVSFGLVFANTGVTR